MMHDLCICVKCLDRIHVTVQSARPWGIYFQRKITCSTIAEIRSHFYLYLRKRLRCVND